MKRRTMLINRHTLSVCISNPRGLRNPVCLPLYSPLYRQRASRPPGTGIDTRQNKLNSGMHMALILLLNRNPRPPGVTGSPGFSSALQQITTCPPAGPFLKRLIICTPWIPYAVRKNSRFTSGASGSAVIMKSFKPSKCRSTS